jgi:hypothetical protein
MTDSEHNSPLSVGAGKNAELITESRGGVRKQTLRVGVRKEANLLEWGHGESLSLSGETVDGEQH